jgi:AcrR family transcriptional regulator
MIQPQSSRPHGSEAVREALIRSAITLFAQFGPSAVSVREIAGHALVNHGLVHRHFGSKEALLEAVLERLVKNLAEEAQPKPGRRRRPARQAFRATRSQNAYLRILAHSLLEERNPEDIQQSFPVMGAMVQAARAAQAEGRYDPKLDPRAVAAIGAALGLGWLMFERFLVKATGLAEEDPTRRLRQLARVWSRMERGLAPKRKP